MMQTHSILHSTTISRATVDLPACRQSHVPVAHPETFPGHHSETWWFPCPTPNPLPYPRDTPSQRASSLFEAIRLKWDVDMLTHAFALSHFIFLRKFARTLSVQTIFDYHPLLFRDPKQTPYKISGVSIYFLFPLMKQPFIPGLSSFPNTAVSS